VIFLILEFLFPYSAQGIDKRELEKFIPSNYRIVKWVEADINRDGKKDIIFGAEIKQPDYTGIKESPPAKIIILFQKAKGLEKVWEFSKEHLYLIGLERESLEEKPLQIADINQDKIPEIIFSLGELVGAGSGDMETFIFIYQNGRFINLVQGNLVNLLDGGLVIRDFDKFKKGKEILVFSMIWGDDECYAGPHRYSAEFYAYSPKIHKYYCYKKVETKKKGSAGLKELGLEF
jgi:hypothetical protein